jgi:VWFA-related protein
MTRPGALLGAMTVWLALMAGPRAQQPSTRPQTPLFRAGVNLVALEVSVLDKQRHPVTDLTATDFTILDGGQPRPVAAFTAVRLPEAAQESPASWMESTSADVVTNQVDGRRLIVIVLSSASPRLASLAHTVVDHLGPADLASVMLLVRPEIGQGFTTDRAKLHDAVDRAAMARRDDMQPPFRPLDTLTTRIASLGPLSDRKKVVYFIHGGGPVGNLASRVDLYATAKRAGVTLNCLAPQIVIPPFDGGCKELASNGGGDAVTDSNAPEEDVPTLMQASGSYYLLGFQPLDPKVNALGASRVEVKVDRPDVEVRTATVRDAVSAASGATPPSPRDAMASALAGAVADDAIPLEISATPFAKGIGATATVVVALTFRLPGIPWSRPDVQEVEIHALAIDGREEQGGRENVHWAARSAAGDREGTVFAMVELAPGDHEIRASLHSTALNRTASVFTTISIVDFAQEALSLSGISVHAEAPMTQVGADALRGWSPTVPTTSRTFATSDHVSTSVLIYQGGKVPLADVTAVVKITNDRDAVVSTTTETLDAERFRLGRRLIYSPVLPLDRLAPGRYLATITATAGDLTAERDLQFTVK